MPLPAGVRLGAYEVLELIGMGGMGEVYRARDSRLQRDVAVKILPSLVAADPDRLARFTREAQVLASLNHPGIAAIYGLEDSEGVQALILELIEGPTLADRIAGGRIALDEAVPIAVQIASALEAAHERGIIHRDLKPANIKVRPDGAVKVLDFGLAKALANDASAPEVAGLPTITSPALTRLGVILGTAAYMSPEQARGKEADKRSDIWAFGCVLYEMLCGRRPFEGGEISDTLASILKTDPDWSALPADTPSTIRRVLRRCLEKDPRRRLHDAADVRLELEDAAAQDGAVTVPAALPNNRRRERVAWALAVASLVLLASLGAFVALKTAPVREVARFHVYPPPNTVLASGPNVAGVNNFALSPDGTRLVFVATDRTGKSQLWIRAFDSFDALPLAGTDDASFPFWSPDARWVAFFAGKHLRKVEASGGSPRKICDLVDEVPRGGTWSSRGDILFSSGNSPRLYRVSDEGGAPVPLPTDQAASGQWPHFLPDGRTFLYLSKTSIDGPGVYVSSIAGSAAPKKLVTNFTNAAYDPSGFLLFSNAGGVLLRRRFDTTRLEVSGEATPVAEAIAATLSRGLAAFSVSANGVLAFQPLRDTSSRFAWFDRSGRMLEPVGEPGKYRHPTLSPDGKRLVYVNLADGNLWILDISRGAPSKFTTGPGSKFAPVWSPDGAAIFYRQTTDDGTAFYQKSASGTTEEKRFWSLKGQLLNGPQQISPDGKWLLYFGNAEGQTEQDIYVLPITGDRKPEPIVKSPYADVEPQFSPDGRFVAYASDETGQLEVYVQPFPATGERWGPLSHATGRQPVWRPDGKELYFVNDDRKFYAVEIKPGPKFDYGPPQFLFDMPANVFNARNSYIPSADGKRFLVNMALDLTAPPIHVVRNWTAGLKN